MRFGLRAIGIGLLLASVAAHANAQELVPPRIIELADLTIPDGVTAPELEFVEALVRVEADGTAHVEETDAAEPWASLVSDAVEHGRFAPATRDGVAISARVRIRIRVRAVVAESESVSVPESVSESESVSEPESAPSADEPYRAVGRVNRPRATVLHLDAEQIRDVPGTFGDPMRIIESLPGVVPIVSGLPYVYVRGAPPAGSSYYWNDLLLPQLFHFALGPAVIHPAFVGDMDFYAGVAPARYGRHTGAVIAAEGATDRPLRREVEVRLLDVNGIYEANVGSRGGRISVAARYGYPGLLLSVLSPNASLSYWDYQSRLTVPVSEHNTVSMAWIGSFDSFGDSLNPDNDVTLEFHRIEARILHRTARFEYGAALGVGYDRSTLGNSLRATSYSITPRVWAQWGGSRLRFRVGGDQRVTMGTFGSGEERGPGEGSDEITNNPLYASVGGRSAYGVYSELVWNPVRALSIDLGLRGDMWLARPDAPDFAVEPRVTVAVRTSDKVTLHAAVGLANQPAVFLLPLPGLTDLQLAHGLQSAVQSELGVRVDLPADFRAEATLYAHRYQGLLVPDLFIEGRLSCLPGDLRCYLDESLPRASAWAYGAELFLKREQGRFSGWISYTLGWATAESSHGAPFTPSFDVRHVGNLVLSWNIGHGWRAGIRTQLRSGRLATQIRSPNRLPILVRYEQRLPWFVRIDAEVSYTWQTSWGSMRAALEWFNATLATEALSIDCPPVSFSTQAQCTPSYGPAIFLPSIGLRATFR
ncbi:MAG: TonB-dependent receptor [Sandaracinaceae bacterium]|nr:TonB-dependent receptor [Sandaracinaceae bacterium]